MSSRNLDRFRPFYASTIISPDKVNQLRHINFFEKIDLKSDGVVAKIAVCGFVDPTNFCIAVKCATLYYLIHHRRANTISINVRATISFRARTRTGASESVRQWANVRAGAKVVGLRNF